MEFIKGTEWGINEVISSNWGEYLYDLHCKEVEAELSCQRRGGDRDGGREEKRNKRKRGINERMKQMKSGKSFQN